MDALEKKRKKNEYARQYRLKNHERLKREDRKRNAQRAVKTQQYRKNMRKTIIDHYGGKCECCGESQYAFLTIDHINGGGTKHKNGIGSDWYLWILRNNFPLNLRVLCWNCNCALGVHGYCPHGNIIKGNAEEKNIDELPLFRLKE